MRKRLLALFLLAVAAAAVVAACQHLRGSGYSEGHDPRLHEEMEFKVRISSAPKRAR